MLERLDFRPIDYACDPLAGQAAKLALRYCSGCIPDESLDLPSIYLSVAKGYENFVVVGAQEELVAVGALSLICEQTAELQHIAVRPDCRRQGAGEFLVSHIEDEARSRGTELMRVRSSVEAIPFYENIGYIQPPKAEHTELAKWL